jgi:hypothetical protein
MHNKVGGSSVWNTGNTASSGASKSELLFATPVVATKIKITPIACDGWCSMRTGLIVRKYYEYNPASSTYGTLITSERA